MKVKYIGESFYNGFGLTKNKTYECIEIEKDMLRIIDDEGEDYLYNANPKDWEIKQDKDGQLEKVLK